MKRDKTGPETIPTRLPCGCRIIPEATATWHYRVDFCPLHKAAPDLLAACKAMGRTHGMHGPCENNSCKSCCAAFDLARAAIAKAEATE